MTDDRRRLVYELLVEAKGIAQQKQKVEQELNLVGKAAKSAQDAIKGALGAAAAAFAVKAITDAIDESRKLTEQLTALGIEGEDAAAGLADVQDIAFRTGQSMQSVSQTYRAAIETIQILGGTQEDAARLAESFTKSVLAEGKGAEVAAQQLEVLQFAIDKNAIKTKELQGLLKDNNTFQQAAQEAMGATTEELLEMASAGKITGEELGKIIKRFNELAAGMTVTLTFDRLVESLKTLSKTFIAAVADAAGLNDALKDMSSQGFQDTMNAVRALANLFGGLIRIVKNFGDTLFDIARFMADIALGKGIRGAIKDLMAEIDKDLAEMQAGVDSVNKAFEENPRPKSSGENLALAEFTPTVSRILMESPTQKVQDMIDDFMGTLANAQAREVDMRHTWNMIADEIQLVNQGIVEQDELLKTTQGTMAEVGDALERQREEQAAKVQEFKDVVSFAFEGLFTGATRSAKEFFKEILRGFAAILAQKAALAATESLFGDSNSGWFSKLFSARGNVFSHGNPLAFANGGIVNGPTLFPMRSGLGVMGEAGAEAIMPLKRLRDGKLGVGASPVNVQVVNNTGVSAAAQVSRAGDRLSIILEAANMGAALAENRMTRSMRTGYGATATALQRGYNLRRTGGTGT